MVTPNDGNCGAEGADGQKAQQGHDDAAERGAADAQARGRVALHTNFPRMNATIAIAVRPQRPMIRRATRAPSGVGPIIA
jgi:hypothetical protein